ncbi:Calcipressin [Marasmius fiardii PR-910]|nr:Calcipressin [Marasmius fiardii PR-910]
MPQSPRSSSVTRDEDTQSSNRTNSLAITPLPKEFFHPQILVHLHHHFETFGTINQWIPLQGFGRILIVYEDEYVAERAKTVSDPIIIKAGESNREQDIVLRVYRADPNPLISTIESENYHLQPPTTDRNFLISPPGSPPVGWEPIREDPPNSTPLADDLITALKSLQVQQTSESSTGVEIVLDASESGVSVVVEDCDFCANEVTDQKQEEDWVYGVTMPSRTKWKPIPTSMPPMRSSSPVPAF